MSFTVFMSFMSSCRGGRNPDARVTGNTMTKTRAPDCDWINRTG